MSLKAWYPLINNLYKNQGTCQGEDTYDSPAFGTTESKLGTSSYTGGNISWTAEQTAKIFNNSALSVAFWIYPISAASGGIIFGIDTYPRRFALYQYHSDANKKGSTFHWSWDPEDLYVEGKRVGATIENAMPIGVWTHICMTYQKGIGGRVYINGSLKTSFAFESAVSDFSTAACKVCCNTNVRYLNDFRVYDHCLSPLEVHNLAQGLFCHYTFDGWHPESENEFVTLVGNSIGSGGALTQESTNTFKLASTTANSPVNTGLWLYWIKDSLPSNTRYVFSVDVYNASQSANINIVAEGKFRFISSNYYIDNKYITCTRKNQWVTIYGVLDTGADGGTYIMFYPNPYNGSFVDGYQLYRNIKLYKGSIPNDITKNITDNSGFSNDSTSFKMYNYASGQVGSKSLVFNGSDTFIALPQSCKIKPPFTYNIWAYMDNWAGISSKTIMSCTQSGGYGLFGSSDGTNIIFEAYDAASKEYKQLRAAVTDYLKPGWHMFTFSLEAGTAYAYIDGKCVNQVPLSVTSFAYNADNTIFVGAEAGNNALTPETNYFNGRIDDFRLYAAILSEDDIKDLYKARCKVDKSQNLITAELIEEVAETNITKQGLLKCHNLVELPDNYDYLEYVEATGNSFFDTGLKGSHAWYHDIQFTDLSGRQLMGYGGNGNEYWGVQSYGNKSGCYGHGTTSSSTYTYQAGNRDIIIDSYSQSPSFVVNGTTLWNGSGTMDLSNSTYKLFDIVSPSDTSWACHCKLYSCAAYSATEAKRIYLPAKTKNGSQVGLYDIIENKFSAISGLTAGPISTNVSQINKYGYSIFNQFIEE